MNRMTFAACVMLWAGNGIAGEYWGVGSEPSQDADGAQVGGMFAFDLGGQEFGATTRKTWIYTIQVKEFQVVHFDGVFVTFQCDKPELTVLRSSAVDPRSLEITSDFALDEPIVSSVGPDTFFGRALTFLCSQQAGQPVNLEHAWDFHRFKGDGFGALKTMVGKYVTLLKRAKASPPATP